MKKTIILMLWVVMLILAGCKPAEAPVGGTSYPAPTQQEETNLAVPGSAEVLYPAPQSGDMVNWDQTRSMILNHEVTEIVQLASMDIRITLKDGRTLLSTQPAMDTVKQVIQECGDPCKDIVVTSE